MATRAKSGTNAAALGKTLAILRKLGRIEDIDAARVQVLESIARTLDDEPSNAQLWRQYREALADLMRVDEDADSGLEQALAEISGAAEMGDSQAS